MKKLPVYLVLACTLTGCATYHISRESLMEQLAGTHPENKQMIAPVPPFFFYYGSLTGNSLTEITVKDKNEKDVTIPVDIHTSVRIIRTDGSKKTFYFNTLLIQDSTITGSNTHFFKSPIKPIYLKDVDKILIQKH